MRNIDNDYIIFLHFTNGRKQLFHLRLGQCGSRLVQNQNLGVLTERLADLYDLPLPHGQVHDLGFGVDPDVHHLQQALGLRLHQLPVDEAARLLRQPPHENIFHNRQRGNQTRLLIHQNNAALCGIRRVPKAQLLSIQIKFAAGRAFRAGEDLAKGGFSRPVFAQKRVDLAAVEGSAHVIQRPGAGIVFHNVIAGKGTHFLFTTLFDWRGSGCASPGAYKLPT